jgi:hypothetical protein
MQLRLYCFEVGHAFAVGPVTSAGRIAFVSVSGVLPGAGGIGAYDAECQAEATTNGLPGTYLAAMATSSATIASRFTGTQPWRRVDGTQVSATGAAMFDGSDLLSFVNQQPNGQYVSVGSGSQRIWTGTNTAMTTGSNSSTCSNWTSTNGGQGPGQGEANYASQTGLWGAYRTGPGNGACTLTQPVLCLQQ